MSRRLTVFQPRKFTSPAERFRRRKFRKICRARGLLRRRRTNFGCFPSRPTACSRGAANGALIQHDFQFQATVTGVILDLEPGALRELHWHPNADEWQYVIEGDLNVTMFASGGRFRTELLHAGDAGYIPQGYGHSIENVGSSPSRILIAFNSRDLRIDRSFRVDCRKSSGRSRHKCQ